MKGNNSQKNKTKEVNLQKNKMKEMNLQMKEINLQMKEQNLQKNKTKEMNLELTCLGKGLEVESARNVNPLSWSNQPSIMSLMDFWSQPEKF